MSTSRTRGRRPPSTWVTVGTALLMGVVYLGVFAWNGDIFTGLAAFGVMLAVAVGLVVFSRRSDTVAMLGDDAHEERHVHIHRRAAHYTLNIVAVVLLSAFVIDIARGGDGLPYVWLAALTGVTYVVFLLVLNRRS